MSTPDDSSLNQKIVAFLGGDQSAGAVLYSALHASLLVLARKRAPDLRNDLEDIPNEVFILLMEGPQRFDPARGSARIFISTILLPEAIQRIRAKMARPGITTRCRHRKGMRPAIGLSIIPDPLPNPDMMSSVGYGSPQAMEAACDARAIWARATPPMKLILGGLLEGKKQSEIAAQVGMDRFRVIRMIAGLQRQFATAA